MEKLSRQMNNWMQRKQNFSVKDMGREEYNRNAECIDNMKKELQGFKEDGHTFGVTKRNT